MNGHGPQEPRPLRTNWPKVETRHQIDPGARPTMKGVLEELLVWQTHLEQQERIRQYDREAAEREQVREANRIAQQPLVDEIMRCIEAGLFDDPVLTIEQQIEQAMAELLGG